MVHDIDFDNKLETIVAPLDVNHFAGDSEKRTTPIVLCLVIGLAPLVIIPYLLRIFPIIFLAITELIWFLVVAAYTIGNHRERVALYKKQLDHPYASLFELLNIKKINKKGRIEYLNNKVAYVVTCKYAGCGTAEEKSQAYERFSKLLNSFEIETDYCFENIVSSKPLARQYKLIHKMSDARAKEVLLANTDYNMKRMKAKSKLYRPVFLLKASKYKDRQLITTINAIREGGIAVRAFKEVKIVTDIEEITDILSADTGCLVDYQELTEMKYANEHYKGCKVLAYDVEEQPEEIEVESDSRKIRGFMTYGR